MKKKLNIDGLLNELKGGSAFFPDFNKDNSPTPPQKLKAPTEREKLPRDDTAIPRYHATMQPSNHDTTIPIKGDGILETVRKAVKQIGKEAATYRFTLEEKNQLEDIKYTYKRQGIETSANEITRISINYFIEDYKKNGEQSTLVKILNLLNS
jgi:hypothetical protein